MKRGAPKRYPAKFRPWSVLLDVDLGANAADGSRARNRACAHCPIVGALDHVLVVAVAGGTEFPVDLLDAVLVDLDSEIGLVDGSAAGFVEPLLDSATQDTVGASTCTDRADLVVGFERTSFDAHGRDRRNECESKGHCGDQAEENCFDIHCKEPFVRLE